MDGKGINHFTRQNFFCKVKGMCACRCVSTRVCVCVCVYVEVCIVLEMNIKVLSVK